MRVSEATHSLERIGISVVAENQPGVLHELTGAIAAHLGNILSVESLETLKPSESRLYFEIEVPSSEALLADLNRLICVQSATAEKSLQKIYGKRIIIMGGGAQVGQVALGAISEADRHNIRGEHISIDTIPLAVSYTH